MRTLLPSVYLALLASWVLLATASSASATAGSAHPHDRDIALHARNHRRDAGADPGSGAAGTGPTGGSSSSSSSSSSGTQAPRPRSPSDLLLTDIVLVTTVEGGLYGLDRTTGTTIWELPAHTSSSALPKDEPFAGFGPLVRSTYGPKRSSFVELLQGGAASGGNGGLASAPTRPKYDTDDDVGVNADAVALLEQVGIYIVEPSSAGDIYMLTPAAHPGSSPAGGGAAGASADDAHGEHGSADPLSVPRTHLSKLPLTLPQLVQLSPFSFAGDDSRIFIGKKSTTLVELDIATGSIGAVWGGSSPDSAGTNTSSDPFEDHSTHGHDHTRRPWTYIGRTDYTLTIHARNRPVLSQTLHFSTYAPTAADLDIQAIWATAGHPDQRAVIGTGEQQTVVCFNLTRASPAAAGGGGGQHSREDERTVWSTSVGGTVAGIFDIVQPNSAVPARAEYRGSGSTSTAVAGMGTGATGTTTAAAASSTSASSSPRFLTGGSRPVIVPHPPVSLSSLFGSSRELSVELGMPAQPRRGSGRGSGAAESEDEDEEEQDESNPLFDGASMGMTETQRPAYLGFSGGSLFAMGSNRFPLAAFSPRAAAGLSGSTSDGSEPTSRGNGGAGGGRPFSSPFDEHDGASDISVRPCSAFGCWLGSYPVEVDTEMDRKVQDALLGSARRPLGIADRHEEYGFGGAPTRSVPGIDAPPPSSTSKDGATVRPGSDSSHAPSGSAGNGSAAVEEKQRWRPSAPSLTTLLFQVVGLGCITLFSYALILGINEQHRQSEERANLIAEQVTFCPQDAPYITDEQANLQLVLDPQTGRPILVMPDAMQPATAMPTMGTPQTKEKPLPAPPLQVQQQQLGPSPEEIERSKRLAAEEEAEAAERARKREEFQRLAQATDVKTLAAFIEQQQSGHASGAASAQANGDKSSAAPGAGGTAGPSANGNANANGKPNGGGKRRRRGKRAGAAVAAKAAARAAAAGGQDAAEQEDDEGEEDESGDVTVNSNGGSSGGPLTSSSSSSPNVLVNGRPTTPGASSQQGGGGTPTKKERGKALGVSPAGGALKSNGVRFANVEEDGGGRLQANGLAAGGNVGAGVGMMGGAEGVLAAPRRPPHSPTTTALLDGGWIQAGPDAQSAEEQLAKMAALASTPGSMRGPGGDEAEGPPDGVGGAGAGALSVGGRQLISKGSGLTISDEVLGYGSSGTVVFKGTFQGRAVAVKRLLRDFVNVASKEVSLLESADNHPNVIRYFYKELTGSFLYIALELCPASLADVIDKPAEFRELHNILEPKRALQQISSGVRHLHSLHIVHRDIKPQNILVAVTPNGKRLKMLLSDFGLSKRLDGLAQSSFSQTVNNPGGTVGWRAPEILRGDVQLDNGGGSESEQSSIGIASDGTRERGPAEERKRLTRAVDIFALGCVAYYILANGEHPFGSRFEREMNIIRNCKNLARLDGLGEEGVEAQHLINAMIAVEPRERPSASDVLSHPYFWDAGKRLHFLQEASDRFEIMERDPPAPALVALEAQAGVVLGGEWYKKVDRAFVDDLGKFRKYDSRSVQDLLRALRNKKHHYQDLSPHLKKLLGPLPGGFLAYFTRRFPLLFMHVHSTLSSQPLIPLEAQFREFFEPVEHEH
ncbi:bifunctional endoribonuclease/protein kinase ire1 [Tilletia horrida]|nr:bifunctional endoribonuclease/protein kinase ire1 [Tilletia horrida]